MNPSGHSVQFFDCDDQQAHCVANYVRGGIDSGCTCIVVATPEHRTAINARLQGLGLDVAALASSYQYVELDAQMLLERFLDGERCNQERFHQVFNTLLGQAASRGEPLRIYGEMVNVLAGQGRFDAALELEELWNELSRQHRFTLLCGYLEAVLAASPRACETMERIRAVHGAVIA
ncbi:MAG TPA: MEDS domain-containing protein [Povalibacter sp.]|nr:MEDS domain-containing protein [Povalibacter sp.]